MKAQVLIALTLFFSAASCQSPQRQQENTLQPQAESTQPAQQVTTEVVIFKNDTMRMPHVGGYGYTIKVNGNPYIFQPTIPAISGNKGFATAEDAQKTADLVSYKLRNNINPPSLTLSELDSLGLSK